MTPGGLLLHPLVLAALGLWAVNDHVLKSAFPGQVTGKLSDVACLIVVPAMVAAAIELFRSRGGRTTEPANGWLIAGAVVAAATMVLINIWLPAAWLYEHGMGVVQWPLQTAGNLAAGAPLHAPVRVQLTMDWTDIFTAPCVLVPIALARRRSQRGIVQFTSGVSATH